MEKFKALDRVISYIIKHEEFSPGSVFVVKDTYQK